MIVLVVEIDDRLLFLINTKGYAPVPADGEAPPAFPVASQEMRLPAQNSLEFCHILHILKERENVAYLLHKSCGQS